MNLVSDTKSRKLAIILSLSIIFVGVSSKVFLYFSDGNRRMAKFNSHSHRRSIYPRIGNFINRSFVICYSIRLYKRKIKTQGGYHRKYSMVWFIIILKEFLNSLIRSLLFSISWMVYLHRFYHVNTSCVSFCFVLFLFTLVSSDSDAKK